MNSINLIKDKKILILIVLAFVIGITLLLFGSVASDEKNSAEEAKQNDSLSYSSVLEEKIEDFLSTVAGIDSVKVFVTVDGGNEVELAKIEEADGYTSDYLVIDKGSEEEAPIIREVYPRIRGVAVSCTGGNISTVQKNITDLLSAGLGISANNIMVTGYK